MRWIAAAIIVLSFQTAEAQSFELLDKSVPIAGHVKRNSPIKFPPPSTIAVVPDTMLVPEVESQPTGVGTYDVLPRCERSEIRRERVLEYSDGSEAIDILYFDPSDQDQLKSVETWPGLAVPFLDSASVNPFAEKDRLQCFARVLAMRCLPTRFRFTEFEGRRVSEFREGAAAWAIDGK